MQSFKKNYREIPKCLLLYCAIGLIANSSLANPKTADYPQERIIQVFGGNFNTKSHDVKETVLRRFVLKQKGQKEGRRFVSSAQSQRPVAKYLLLADIKILRNEKKKNEYNLVEGYRDSTYVYGQVRLLSNGVIEGYIYELDNTITYVYGRKTRKSEIGAYDKRGNVYRLVFRNNMKPSSR